MKLWIAAIALLSLLSCKTPSRAQEEVSKEKKIVVLSTTAMIQDVVERVGGDKITSYVLIQGEIDPHSYELVKGDDEKIEGADVVFFNGLQLEHGASLRYKLSAHPDALAVGDYLLKKCPDSILKEQGQVDPHVWMDVSLWSQIVDPIVEKLVAIDPSHEVYYRQRAKQAQEEMMVFHQQIKDKLKKVPESKRYLVTSHDAFGYFTRQYLAEEAETDWKKRFAAPEGLAPDGQLGVIDLQKIVDYLVLHQIGVVFPESNVSKDSLRKIVFACKEKQREIRFSSKALYGDCMGEEKSYLDMISHNAEVLITEWNKE